ncbi:MAG TPA: DUF4097 family beta strand repeat-containing protein [Amycolatopsis sp.]|nr:DUF4097 family beta strand repeat-containing protein [Amycolatopsis sp.]
MARPALAIGGIALIGVGVAIGFGWWSPSTSTVDRQVAQRIDTVTLDVGSGDVHLRAGDVGTTTIHQRFHYNGSQPGDAFAVTGTRLELRGCGDNCTVDYDVVVPRGTIVTGEANSGDITAQGLAATDVTTRSGEVHVTDAAGPVTVHANSGDISVALARPEDVQANANSGDVKVTVPANRYRLQIQTRSGDQDISVENDPAGTHVLDLQANSGDVKLAQSAA